MLVPFLAAAISMGIVYLYGSIGETIIEKGGNLNLGIPGIMCLRWCCRCKLIYITIWC